MLTDAIPFLTVYAILDLSASERVRICRKKIIDCIIQLCIQGVFTVFTVCIFEKFKIFSDFQKSQFYV